MNTFEIVFTVVNAIMTSISVICAIRSSRQTKFQTEIMRQQLEESQKPNFEMTGRLEGISTAIYQVKGAINELSDKQ